MSLFGDFLPGLAKDGGPMVSYSATASAASGNITIPAHNAGDMLLFMDRGSTATPPSLTAGYTNVCTAANTTSNVSHRVQFKIADGSDTTQATAAGGRIWVIRGARSARGVDFTSSAAATTSHVFTDLAGCVPNGLNAFIATIRASDSGASAVSSPWSLPTSTGWALVTGSNYTTSPACTITTALSLAQCRSLVELVI